MDEKQIVEAGEYAVEQVRQSKQPRLSEKDADQIFWSIYEWVKKAELEAPTYASDNRIRDAWLRTFVKQEPLLNGVLSSCVSIDKNRGWTLEGGARQVEKYTNILHNVENGLGWRYFASLEASSYYGSDMGSIAETERELKPAGGAPLPPIVSMYFVDPTRARLKPKNRLTYYPQGRAKQEWEAYDFFRVTSMPSTDERFLGLGYCAISRSLELAMIAVSIWEHDMEKLGAKAPKGLMLLQNISENQWDTAMQARKEKMHDYEQQYYSNVAVLATEGPDTIDAKLIALSNMPENMNRQEVVNTTMYGYALEFEFDPREFWPVSSGQLGTATETEVQHKKATGKGGMNFALGMQEHIQKNIPDALNFQFEQRDVDGELADINLMQAKIDAIAKVASIQTNTSTSRPVATEQTPKPDETTDMQRDALTDLLGEVGQAAQPVTSTLDTTGSGMVGISPGVSTSSGQETAITRDEVRIMLAEAGIIPHEWTVYEEEVQASDLESSEDETLRSNIHIQRAAMLFPNEPIVRYHFPSNRLTILFKEGNDVFHRRSFPVAKIHQSRRHPLRGR